MSSPMSSARRTSAVAGSLYLVTHVTSVVGLILYGRVVSDAGHVIDNGDHTRVLLGAFLEVILAAANIGTAVTLFPVVKRYNEGVALGYVGLRTLEAAVIAVGVVPLLALVRPGTAPGLGKTLVALHNWTFLVGPGLILGINTVLMAYLMYRSHLVPRFIPILGLVGGPLVFVSESAELFGRYGQFSSWGVVAALPAFAWELGFAFYMIIKGFRPAALRPAA